MLLIEIVQCVEHRALGLDVFSGDGAAGHEAVLEQFLFGKARLGHRVPHHQRGGFQGVERVAALVDVLVGADAVHIPGGLAAVARHVQGRRQLVLVDPRAILLRRLALVIVEHRRGAVAEAQAQALLGGGRGQVADDVLAARGRLGGSRQGHQGQYRWCGAGV